MNQINLIPPHRLRANARRRWVRRWVGLAAAHCALLALAYGACYLAWGGDAARPPDVAATAAAVVKLNASLASLRARCAQGREELRSIRDVSDQPDWSLLLAGLAESLGDDVALTRCELTRPGPKPAGVPPGRVKPVAGEATSTLTGTVVAGVPPTAFVFHLEGLGRSQEAVTQFALRLERAGVFEHVTLIQSNYSRVFRTEAITFSLECPLRGQGGETR